MGLFGKHDDQDHRHYKMTEKMFSVGDDYWIEDDQGERRYKVNGKAMHVRDTWVLENAAGAEVAKIHERMLSLHKTILIELDGRTATVKKALVGLRDRFVIEVDGGDELKAHGNIVDHEYVIERDGDTLAEISKKWFRMRDTYGIEIREPALTVLLLAISVAVDALAHDGPLE